MLLFEALAFWLLLSTSVTADSSTASASPFTKAYVEAKGGNMTISVPFGSKVLLQYHSNETGKVVTAPSALLTQAQANTQYAELEAEFDAMLAVGLASINATCVAAAKAQGAKYAQLEARWLATVPPTGPPTSAPTTASPTAAPTMSPTTPPTTALTTSQTSTPTSTAAIIATTTPTTTQTLTPTLTATTTATTTAATVNTGYQLVGEVMADRSLSQEQDWNSYRDQTKTPTGWQDFPSLCSAETEGYYFIKYPLGPGYYGWLRAEIETDYKPSRDYSGDRFELYKCGPSNIQCIPLYATTLLGGSSCVDDAGVFNKILAECNFPTGTIGCGVMEGHNLLAFIDGGISGSSCAETATAMNLMIKEFTVSDGTIEDIGCAFSYLYDNTNCGDTSSVLNDIVAAYETGLFANCG